jgi:hypothetical protein
MGPLLLSVLGLTLAHAAELALPDLEPVQGRAFEPRADARHFLLTEDARRDTRARARLVASWDTGSLLTRYDLGAPGRDAADQTLAIVGPVWALQPVVSRGFGPVRITGSVPLLAWSRPDVVQAEGGVVRSDAGSSGSAVGDPHLGLKGVILDQDRSPVGIATYGRLAVSLGAAEVQLGQPGTSGELGLALGAAAGPVELGASVGWRLLPTAQLDGATLDDQLAWTAGGALPVGPAGISAEVWGLSQPGDAGLRTDDLAPAANNPVQALVGAWWGLPGNTRVRLMGGTGLTGGLGSATARVLLALESGVPAAPGEGAQPSL